MRQQLDDGATADGRGRPAFDADEPLGQERLAGADELAQLPVTVHLARVRVEHHDVTGPGGLQLVGVTARQRSQILRDGIGVPGRRGCRGGPAPGRHEVRKPRHRNPHDGVVGGHSTNVGTLAVRDRAQVGVRN